MIERRIIHIDMDQFFAAVEQRDHPELRGKPLAVGHNGQRGVVSTASYEARRYGVHSAQSIQVAKRLCPELIIVEPHFHRYKEVSMQIHNIMHDYTDLIEPISLDEAFLDVTQSKATAGIQKMTTDSQKQQTTLAVDIARAIKQRISETTGLTASAGVSYCKFLAKIASDWQKPDGLTVIHPDHAQAFIDRLQVTRIWGVGHKTAAHMHHMGIFTGADLRRCSQSHLIEEFGKMGRIFYDFARGIDERPVVAEWERKSVSCERTFEKDIVTSSTITIELYHIVEELLRRLEKSSFEGRTLTLKVKFSDLRQITRSLTVLQPLRSKEQILPLAKQLMTEVAVSRKLPVRLLGLGVSHAATDGKEVDAASAVLWREMELPFEPWE